MLSAQDSISRTDVLQCKICRGKLVCDPDSGESICSSCGTVCDERAWASPYGGPWSIAPFEAEDSRRIAYDIDLPGIIGNRNLDAHGNGISDSYALARLRKLDNLMISRDSKRRSLFKAIRTIKQATEMLGVGASVEESAYEIYRRANESGKARRKAITDLALASVYVALRELGIARSVQEIDEVTRELNARSARKYYHQLLNELKIHSTSTDACSFVSRIAARAGLSGKIERRAIEILKLVKDNPSLISKKPVPLAASAIYLAAELCGEPVTQLRIASASDVTPVTIRKRSLELSKILLDTGGQEVTARERALEHLLATP